MIKKYVLIIVVAVLGFSCTKNDRLSLVNTLDKQRTDEAIIIKRGELAKKVPLTEGMLPAFKSGDQFVPSQVDDLDGDGRWDEVVLVTDFAANETKALKVVFLPPSQYPKFPKRTNLRLGILQPDGTYREVDSYEAPPCDNGFKIIAQAEGVSWENDKMCFRVYFDCRNVKDLFGKLKPEMVADKLGTPEMGDYHQLADWGMDILECGSSLGAGGLALLRDDSLYRLGSTKVYKYKKIVEGPLRSVFDLIYSGWDVNGQMMGATERITIFPGKYWFESEVTFDGCNTGDQIVTGIVTTRLKNKPFEFSVSGYKCIGTHGVQSMNNDELGMAILVPAKSAGKVGRTTDIDYYSLGYRTVVEKSFSNIISGTYYIGQDWEDGYPSKHYFFAVWGLENDRWKTEDGFKNYIIGEAEKFSDPIKIQ